MKVKILHALHAIRLGGAEKYALDLACAVNGEQFESHLAYACGGEYEKRYSESGLPLFKYAQETHKIKSPASLAIISRLVAYMRKNGIQIVHTYNFNAHIWSLAAAKLARVKIVEHVHDFRYLEPDEYRRRGGTITQWRFARYLKNTADRVIVLTEQNKQFLLKNHYYPESRVFKLYNGISLSDTPLADRAAVKSRLGLAAEDLVIYSSGRIMPDKNFGLILRIAPKVIERFKNVKFLINGDGPLLNAFRQECREKRLEDHVRFMGFNAEPQEILSIADIVLHPSLLELHSLSILEALKMGIPVVVSKDVGSHNEIFTQWQNAVLLDPFNPDEWVPAVLKLLEDDRLRRSIGQNGYELCKARFDMKKAAGEIKDLYLRLLT